MLPVGLSWLRAQIAGLSNCVQRHGAGQDPPGYAELLTSLKAEVRASKVRAHRVVNTELLTLYWTIGRAILDRQAAEGWAQASSTASPTTCGQSSRVIEGSYTYIRRPHDGAGALPSADDLADVVDTALTDRSQASRRRNEDQIESLDPPATPRDDACAGCWTKYCDPRVSA